MHFRHNNPLPLCKKSLLYWKHVSQHSYISNLYYPHIVTVLLQVMVWCSVQTALLVCRTFGKIDANGS